MSGSDNPVPGINPSSSINARQSQLQRLQSMRKAQNISARQMLLKETMTERCESALFNPLAMLKKAETLEKRLKKHEVKKEEEAKDEDLEVAKIDDVTKSAKEFEKQNPEMQERALLSLRRSFEIDDTPEQILAKILKSYPDEFLADEALTFLCDNSDRNTKVGGNLRLAKELLNETYGREVRAGRNMNTQAREFSKQGLGKAGALRDLYRDITGTPRETVTLFEELTENFTFDKMKTVLQFVLHSLGSDMKAKGPSISRAELQRLFTETRSVQSILGVYRFFYQRMRLITNLFQRDDLALPKRLSFEVLAKYFVKLISERYPSVDKVLRLASQLGISEELLAQVIIFTQYRDALRSVSPRLFKSDKHRQDLLMTLIETISELDDLLEDEDEEDEEDDDDKKPPGWNQKDTME